MSADQNGQEDRRPKPHDFLEDAEAGLFDTSETPLEDEELRRRGMAPVRAYVQTKASRAAARAAKKRKRDEAEGKRQVNVIAPAEARPAITGLAKALTEGRVTADQVEGLIGGDTQPLDQSERLARKRSEQIQGMSVQTNQAAAGGRRLPLFLWGLMIGFVAGVIAGLSLPIAVPMPF